MHAVGARIMGAPTVVGARKIFVRIKTETMGKNANIGLVFVTST